jgi:hypothetical protein
MLNQDQQQYNKNVRSIIQYIKQDTEKKIENIRKEATKECDLEKTRIIGPEKEKIKTRILKELEDYRTNLKM